MSRPPRKFTDASRSQITQEWQDWYAQEQSLVTDELKNHVVFLGEPLENRWPEDFDKDLGEVGAWILVVSEPYTEIKSRFTVPTPSLWWARPAEDRPYSMNIGSASHPKVIPGVYRAVIETPGGSLWLYPHEYVVCSDPLPLITDPECTLHSLGGRPALDEEKREQMFYLQVRGWCYHDALLALMDGLDMRDWGWVEFPENVRSVFEGVGARPTSQEGDHRGHHCQRRPEQPIERRHELPVPEDATQASAGRGELDFGWRYTVVQIHYRTEVSR